MEEWLRELWEVKLNRDFKTKVSQVPVIERIRQYLAVPYSEYLASKESTASVPENNTDEQSEERKGEELAATVEEKKKSPMDETLVQMMLQDDVEIQA